MGCFFSCEITEPNKHGEFVTLIELGVKEESVELSCSMSQQNSSFKIQPMSNQARCPRVFRDIVGSNGQWKVGINPVLQTPIQVSGISDANELIRVMMAETRKVPVVAVSEIDGTAFDASLAETLARDLCGLAYVVHLDEEASWQLTSSIGRKWSCYNRAIRVYWPSIRDLNRPERHPIWTADRLLKNDHDVSGAVVRLRNQLRKMLLELSNFAQSGRSVCDQIRNDIRESENQEARDEEDWKGLAESYGEDTIQLKENVRKLENENGKLGVELIEIKEELKQVKQSFHDYDSWQGQSEESSTPSAEQPEPQTIEEAIKQAESKHKDLLLFGSDVKRSVQGLQQSAGPPDKILRYLDTLAEMTEICLSGTLGDDQIHWLNERNVDASDESEGTRNNKRRMNERNWDDGSSKRQFRYHLKPSNHTRPDLCVRIYFEFIKERGRTVVGWVGRHLEP